MKQLLGYFLLHGSVPAPSQLRASSSDSAVGVESPSHAIRADADPLARSATSVVITLADKYTYDCPVRILIYPSGRSTPAAPSLECQSGIGGEVGEQQPPALLSSCCAQRCLGALGGGRGGDLTC